MKGINYIFIALEIGAIIGLCITLYLNDAKWYYNIYALLFSILAVCYQREQQAIES